MAAKKKEQPIAQPVRAAELTPLLTEPAHIKPAQTIVLYDLAIIIGATYQQVIEPTQAGSVPKRLANKIFPLLHGSRPDYYDNGDLYLDMLFHAALQTGLLQLSSYAGSTKPRYMPGPSLEKWMGMSEIEQIRLLLSYWVDNGNSSWTDIVGTNYAENYTYYMDTLAARKGFLTYMAQMVAAEQTEKWYAIAPFLQAFKTQNPLMLRQQSRYAPFLNSEQARKNALTSWENSDGEVIVGLLDSTLYEFGLVATGWQRDLAGGSTQEAHQMYHSGDEDERNPDAFQLTELARRVFLEKETPPQTTSEQQRDLIVQPNFELLLLQPNSPTLYQLLPFARVDQVEMVSRLTLTQESVRRGVEAGWSVERIQQTLQEHSQKELPQNVLYTLQDWGKLYKNATVSQVILLEVGSETVADEICASAKFRALGLRRLGPCAIAVGGQVSTQVLRSTLEKDGVIMRVQGDILTARDNLSTYYGKQK